MKKLFLTTLVTFMTSVVMAQMLPYQNPNLTAEQRADDLLGRLTLEEKAKLMCEACDAPVVKGNGSTLSWESVPYAICYVITKNGEVAGFTTQTSFDGYTANDTWQVQAVNEYGGLSQKATAHITTGISQHPTPITQHPSPIFNLAGQKVGADFKGLMIKNGVKVVIK